MNKIHQFIARKASIKNIIIGLILIVLFNTVFLPYATVLLMDVSLPIADILDLKFTYNSDTVYNLFEKLDEKGRKAYQFSALIVDNTYAVIYSFTYAFIIYMLLKATDLLKHKLILLLPFFIGLFDILENFCIAILLQNHPNRLDGLVSISSLATSLKWVAAILTFMVILGSIIHFSWRKIKQK